MTITDRPLFAVICTSRPRNFPVGMPATVRRNPRPRRPREGRFPVRSRPSARAWLKSRSSITTARAPCCFAVAMRALTAARSRPSRVVGGQPGQLQRDRDRGAQHVAVRRDDRDGQVGGVDVDRHHRVSPQFLQRRRRGRGGLPAGVQVPAPGCRVTADVVPDRPGGGLRGDLVPPVGEGDRARQPVPPVRPVRQVRQRQRGA